MINAISPFSTFPTLFAIKTNVYFLACQYYTVNLIMTCINYMYTVPNVTLPLIKLKQFLLH